MPPVRPVLLGLLALPLLAPVPAAHAHGSPTLELAPPGPVRPGDTVQVRGRVGGPGPVAIRWREVGRAVAATAGHDGYVTAAVRVPELAAGVHYLVLVAGGASVAWVPVEVVPGRSQPHAPWAAAALGAACAGALVAATRRRCPRLARRAMSGSRAEAAG